MRHAPLLFFVLGLTAMCCSPLKTGHGLHVFFD